MEKTMLIKNARAIVTCDAEDHVFFDMDMLIRGPQIVKIGKDLTDPCDEVIDASRMFVYPGMINTHHHFFQTFVRNLKTIDYPNMTVPQWLDEAYRVFQMVDGEVIFYSSLTAFADLIRHGCTCAFDHQYCYTDKTGKTPVDRQMEAARLLGIRYHAGRGTNTLPREEGSTMPAVMVETTDEFLQDCERIIGLYHDPKPFSMSQIVMAPCQPMNCYKDTFTETVKFARDKGVRMHTHLGEGENEIMQARWGMRTLDWCEEIGYIGPDVWFGIITHGFRRSVESKLFQYPGNPGIVRSSVQLPVRKGSCATFAELNIVLGIQRPAGLKAVNRLPAGARVLSPLQDNGAKPCFGKNQGSKHSGRTEADYHRAFLGNA